ncbi:MAG TPA: hypothetical protein VHM70_03535 [Polyangiaceae bacterium]|jgi:hypothetical protein|nr:hypothetical protein [Polyangiaceae bacterium]
MSSVDLAPAPVLTLPALSGDVLCDLERLLEIETDFLSRLDMAGIDAVAERKEQLLSDLGRVKPQTENVQQLQRIRSKAIENQLLTVHARDAVAAIIFAVEPANNTTYSPATERPLPKPGVRLNVRG